MTRAEFAVSEVKKQLPVAGMEIGLLITDAFRAHRSGPWSRSDFSEVFRLLYADPEVDREKQGRYLMWVLIEPDETEEERT